MKLKSLLFGSAAVIAAGTGAQAADLPTAEPVEYVRICDAFGTGFYYIPGTDTCLKISGRVFVESGYVFGDNDDEDIGTFFPDEGPWEFNNYTTRFRADIRFDARTQTEMGLLRSYIDMRMTQGNSNFGTDYSSTSPDLNAAFIQLSSNFGTYTAGHTSSFFDFWGSDTYGMRLNIDDPTTNATLFGYTFAVGNGFSFTLAAEDPASSFRRINPATVGGSTVDDYEGQEFPDGVANIRVDQGWGSAQIMGAVHGVHDIGVEGGAPDVDDTEIGWAVGAGLSIGVPGGWKIQGQGGYSEGAIGYVTTDPFHVGDFFGDELNKAWNVRAGVIGPLINPKLTVWADGSFTHAEGGVDSDYSYDFWAAAVGASYELVPGLTMGPEFAYNSVDFGDDVPADDADVFGVMWHVERSF